MHFAPPWTSPHRVDPAHPHHLVNAEGRHLFILSKTAWGYFGCAKPEEVLVRAKADGANVIRVAVEKNLYPEVLKMDLWPFGGTRSEPDLASLNHAYLDEVERRVVLAGQAGIGLNITLCTTWHPADADAELYKPFVREVVTRLGKYANVLVWEVQNEYLENEGYQDVIGPYIHSLDPVRPVVTSDHTWDNAAWPHKDWVSMATVHTCTGSGNGSYTLAGWYLPVARNIRSHGKPAWTNESGRERRHKNDDPIHRRKQGWLWYAAGCYWNWHSWDGCEGIDDPVSTAPGRGFLPGMVRFWSGLPYHALTPDFTAWRPAESADGALVSAVLSTGDRALLAAYMATEESGRAVAGATFQLRLPPGKYQLSYIHAATGEAAGGLEYTSRHIKEVTPIKLPPFIDDLALTITRLETHRRTMIPGTA